MKLSIATYYKPTKITKGYGLLYDENGDEISERERGLDGKCEVGGYHDWLLLPKQKEQKQYLYCLKCGETSHT